MTRGPRQRAHHPRGSYGESWKEGASTGRARRWNQQNNRRWRCQTVVVFFGNRRVINVGTITDAQISINLEQKGKCSGLLSVGTVPVL